MSNKIDELLNSITMYRLILYYLILLSTVAFIYSIFHLVPFEPFSLIFSIAILLGASLLSNKIFENFFKVQTNFESVYITALILALIITPAKFSDLNNFIFLVLVSFIATASKYILNIKGKHIFNPAAIAVFVTGLLFGQYASWWIATKYMFPFLLLGILIVRKIRRYDLVFYFFVTSLIGTLFLSFLRGNLDILKILKLTFLDSPILFFAFVMLTEPLTTPPTSFLQSLYGGLTGILFAPIHIGFFYTTPEIALSLSNIFSYVVSPKQKLTLTLKEKLKLTPDIYDFIFTSKEKLTFKAGQYLEWTLSQKQVDSRGNRRYFTVASSPTEEGIRIGVKFPENESSSFKKEMLDMKIGKQIVASGLSGDFTLPKGITKKLVFIAGGIGVTPYRSIIKYLVDTNEKRDIILLYSDKDEKQFVYKDIFNEAIKKFGIKTIYYETEKQGHINADFIKKEIPDFKERMFYISGSHGMVTGFENTLKESGIHEKQIKIDYFPGF